MVFWFLDPLNNDVGHLDVIKYIVEHRALPAATASFESYQPPLYYLLAAPFYAASGNVKWVQLLSLVFSILTLLVIYRLLYCGQTSGRRALLPLCVSDGLFSAAIRMFGLYVSNDTLAILIGAVIVLQVVRFVAAPTIWQAVLLAVARQSGAADEGDVFGVSSGAVCLGGVRAPAARVFGTQGVRCGAGFIDAGGRFGELEIRSELSRS